MGDYISREAAIKAVKKERGYTGKFSFEEERAWTVGFQQGITFALSDIASITAADVRPVVWGRWIPDYDYAEYDYDGSTPLPEPQKFQDGWQCSLCGQYMPSETNFCPNCGADMRGEQDV